jgi:TldD protein
MSLGFGRMALKEAEKGGASYADIRVCETVSENLTAKNGEAETTSLSKSKGFGVRIIVDCAWGFAGSIDVNREEIKRTVKKAVKIAKASGLLKKREAVLTRERAKQGKYATKLKRDPFKVPIEEKLEILIQTSRFLKDYSPLIKAS